MSSPTTSDPITPTTANPAPATPETPAAPQTELKRTAPLYEPGHAPWKRPSPAIQASTPSAAWLVGAGFLVLLALTLIVWYLLTPH